VVRVIGIAHDATARKLAEQHRELLIRELNHRVKNTLATVQSIAAQTLSTGCEPAVREAFAARLISLAGAHDLLTRGNWEGAGLAEVAQEALGPHLGDGRIALSGPNLRLSPKAAVAFGMAFHELATNAAKYGALSVPEGRITLAWEVEGEGFRLRWMERGGPPVAPPTHRGFGSRLLERGLPHELHGALRLDFRPGGLDCTISAPLTALTPPQEIG
jgi:two-component sensor histidine kinase